MGGPGPRWRSTAGTGIHYHQGERDGGELPPPADGAAAYDHPSSRGGMKGRDDYLGDSGLASPDAYRKRLGGRGGRGIHPLAASSDYRRLHIHQGPADSQHGLRAPAPRPMGPGPGPGVVEEALSSQDKPLEPVA